MMMDRNRTLLLRNITKAGFILYDLQLYLDTHPTDINALRQYGFYQKKHGELKSEYERKYGPLTPKMSNSQDRWNWCDGPWPWENEYNGGNN